MKPVIVTTKHRGVFFGYLKEDDKAPSQLTLTNARNCLYWSADVGGFLGLAAIGPTSGCRIGKKVSELKLYDITSTTLVEEDAVKKWEAA